MKSIPRPNAIFKFCKFVSAELIYRERVEELKDLCHPNGKFGT